MTEELIPILSRGPGDVNSGYGCAMNVLSWEMKEDVISDRPESVADQLAYIVQSTNDTLAHEWNDEIDFYVVPTRFGMRMIELAHSVAYTAHEGQHKHPQDLIWDIPGLNNLYLSWQLLESEILQLRDNNSSGRGTNLPQETAERIDELGDSLIDAAERFIAAYKEKWVPKAETFPVVPGAVQEALRKMYHKETV